MYTYGVPNTLGAVDPATAVAAVQALNSLLGGVGFFDRNSKDWRRRYGYNFKQNGGPCPSQPDGARAAAAVAAAPSEWEWLVQALRAGNSGVAPTVEEMQDPVTAPLWLFAAWGGRGCDYNDPAQGAMIRDRVAYLLDTYAPAGTVAPGPAYVPAGPLSAEAEQYLRDLAAEYAGVAWELIPESVRREFQARGREAMLREYAGRAQAAGAALGPLLLVGAIVGLALRGARGG